MIESQFLSHLANSKDCTVYPYASPVGRLLIIGAGHVLQAIVFSGPKPGMHILEKNLPHGENRATASCRAFLDYYFTRASAARNNELLKPSVRLNTRSSFLHISWRTISLTIECSDFTPAERLVYAQLARVPFGSTISYGSLAHRSGFPRGGRFAGSTMAKNSVPIIIPCHRVIRSDGSIGNYSGGVHIKEYLLAMEQEKLRQ